MLDERIMVNKLLKNYRFYSPGEILDAVTAQKGTLSLFMGHPSTGKTTLVLSGLQERPELNVFIQLLNRHSENIEEVYETRVDSGTIQVADEDSFSLELLMNQLETFKRSRGLDLVVVDEVMIANQPSMLKAFKRMALDLNICVLALYRLPETFPLLSTTPFWIDRLGMPPTGTEETDNLFCIENPGLKGIDEDLNGFSIKNSAQLFGIKGVFQNRIVYLDFERNRKMFKKAIPERVVKRTIRKNQIIKWISQR